jgi:hypothetical protein
LSLLSKLDTRLSPATSRNPIGFFYRSLDAGWFKDELDDRTPKRAGS